MKRENMTFAQRAESSLLKEFRKPIWRPFMNTVRAYELIKPGDKIAVCISGGKDSMTAQLADYIDGGRIQLFVVDTVDIESWSNEGGDNAWRAERQEQYYHYIVDEVIPLMRERNDALPVVTGLSMGATHAAIVFLRRPDLFRGIVALSGVYDSDYFFHGWMNPTLYENSPERFLPNLPVDHPYVNLYNQRQMIFCVGQGAWEEDGVRTLRHLECVFREKGIHTWCDFWGHDVNHDWPWWYRQMRYFIPYVLGEK